MNVVLYVRSARNDDNGLSNAAQIAQCRALTTTIIQESSTVKVIIVTSIDRITDNAVLWEQLGKTLKEADITVVSVTEG